MTTSGELRDRLRGGSHGRRHRWSAGTGRSPPLLVDGEVRAGAARSERNAPMKVPHRALWHHRRHGRRRRPVVRGCGDPQRSHRPEVGSFGSGGCTHSPIRPRTHRPHLNAPTSTPCPPLGASPLPAATTAAGELDSIAAPAPPDPSRGPGGPAQRPGAVSACGHRHRPRRSPRRSTVLALWACHAARSPRAITARSGWPTSHRESVGPAPPEREPPVNSMGGRWDRHAGETGRRPRGRRSALAATDPSPCRRPGGEAASSPAMGPPRRDAFRRCPSQSASRG